MRFLLDHDVDAAVGTMLRRHGHECWTAGQVGLAVARDDDLTVWATAHSAVLVSTDKEFGRRRLRNADGHHIWLRCPDWDAADVLEKHLANVLEALRGRAHLTIRVSKGEELSMSSDWR